VIRLKLRHRFCGAEVSCGWMSAPIRSLWLDALVCADAEVRCGSSHRQTLETAYDRAEIRITWGPSCASLVAIRSFACQKKRFIARTDWHPTDTTYHKHKPKSQYSAESIDVKNMFYVFFYKSLKTCFFLFFTFFIFSMFFVLFNFVFLLPLKQKRTK